MSESSVTISDHERKYKPLHKVYTVSMFFLAFMGMYPNHKYDHIRKRTSAVLITLAIPGIVIMSVDARNRFYEKDYENISRQIIAVVSIIFTSIKMVCSILKKRELRAVIDQVNKDYDRFNTMPEDYQTLIDESMALTRKVDKVWHGVLYATAVSYPALAVVSTIYSQLFSDTPERFLFHEVNYWGVDRETQYATPCFEYLNIYEMYIIFIVTFGFLGYDSSFIIFMFHAALKLKLISRDLVHMLDATDNVPLMKAMIAKFVKDHLECRVFVENIQKSFEVWLAGIFCHGILQLGMALTQTTFQDSQGGAGSNFTYYFYVLATVLHIFLPCFLASDLRKLFIPTFRLLCSSRGHGRTGGGLFPIYLAMVLVAGPAPAPNQRPDSRREMNGHTSQPAPAIWNMETIEEKLAQDAYECLWEDVPERGVEGAIMMIIQRTQQPNEFTALGILTFNMELFVSVLQTSYSMYTLLRN